MAPISARSRSPIKVLLSIESSGLRASSADSTGVFPRFITYLGPRTEAPELTSKMPTVVKRSNSWRLVSSQVLLHRRFSRPVSSFLNVRRNRDGFDLTRLEPALVALVEESFYRAGISCARVAVADAGGEKFDETATVALTSIPDEGRPWPAFLWHNADHRLVHREISIGRLCRQLDLKVMRDGPKSEL